MLSCCFSRPGRPPGPRPPRSGPLLLSSKPTPESLTFMDLMPEDWCQQCLHLWFVKSLGWFILLPFGPGFLLELHFSPRAGELLCHGCLRSPRRFPHLSRVGGQGVG